MYYKLCRKWHKLPRSGAPIWPYVLIRLESVTRHYESKMHKAAIKQELEYQQASIDGGIAKSFEHQWETEESATCIKAVLYFFGMEEIPHTTTVFCPHWSGITTSYCKSHNVNGPLMLTKLTRS